MAKKQSKKTAQMNVRVDVKVLKAARQLVKTSGYRLGEIVEAALDAYVRANVS